MGKKDKKKSGKGKIIFVVILLAIVPVVRMAITFTTKAPPSIGLKDGQLAPLPKSPNAVSSTTENKDRQVKSIPFRGDVEIAKKRLKDIIQRMARTKLVTEKDNYLHYEFRTMVFNFTDDVEFLFDESSEVIHVRSASRLGRSDFGVNKRRCEDIRKKFIEDEAEKK